MRNLFYALLLIPLSVMGEEPKRIPSGVNVVMNTFLCFSREPALELAEAIVSKSKEEMDVTIAKYGAPRICVFAESVSLTVLFDVKRFDGSYGIMDVYLGRLDGGRIVFLIPFSWYEGGVFECPETSSDMRCV